MKKTKTLFDQAIEIIEAGGEIEVYETILINFVCATVQPYNMKEYDYFCYVDRTEILEHHYMNLLLARELWNDGQEKYWKQGLFK